MYPYPVSGRVGFIPRVTIASESMVKSRHDFITLRNSAVLVTIWSLGVTTMLALGSCDFIFQLTYAMHGAVFLLQGSHRILPAGKSGSCSLTMLTYALLVTIHTFSGLHIPLNLSTVSCSSDFPTPSTSINCLGFSTVLMGQNRLPTPPAIMTRWLFLLPII